MSESEFFKSYPQRGDSSTFEPVRNGRGTGEERARIDGRGLAKSLPEQSTKTARTSHRSKRQFIEGIARSDPTHKSRNQRQEASNISRNVA